MITAATSSGVHDRYTLRRSGHLQIIELAVQEPRGKGKPVPGGELGHV